MTPKERQVEVSRILVHHVDTYASMHMMALCQQLKYSYLLGQSAQQPNISKGETIMLLLEANLWIQIN